MERNDQMVDLLRKLLDCISQTIDAGEKFLKDDMEHFSSSNPESPFSISLQGIRKIFSQLDSLKGRLERQVKVIGDDQAKVSR
jgi:hypothetical protein